MPDLRFKRGERLKSRKAIGQLFEKGQSFGQYPLRLVWMPVEEPLSSFNVQLAISVPKRRFKKAHQRNRLKRQIREAYRLNKSKLYANLATDDQAYSWMLIYTAREALPFADIEKAIEAIIPRFLRKIAKDATNP